MADLRKAGAKFAKAFEQASNEAEAAYKAAKEAEKTSKLDEALKAKQAPMTTPSGTGLPLMPRTAGMYTPGVEQKDLPRMPMVDKARAKGEKPKYTERMQDLLDSPTARKKVDTLIEKGDELGMREWYGTEPLRQVAMDIGMNQKQFDEFLAQMASASQRNPVDQQNRMGSYLWHLSQTGQLPEDAFLMTNKIKRGKQARPEGTAIELPPGYGSLAQGDIFSRGKQIAAGDIEGALPPDKKLGTFYRNYQGNLKPVTVDVNAVRGPIIERGDPRWLASKLVEKDEEGNVIATHFPRKQVESGLMSLKEAKARPGFWEAAPSGSEYAGFEDLWQRAAKRKGVAPAEAQALGWYGSADVTALKTKPELYIENLERMIRRTAEQTGQNPRQVMEDVLRGKTYLKKKGGAVSESEYQKKLDAMLEKHMAGGGAAFKRLPMKANGGVIDNMTPDMTDSGDMNWGGEYASGGGIKAVPWKKSLPNRMKSGGRVVKLAGGGGIKPYRMDAKAARKYFDVPGVGKVEMFVDEANKRIVVSDEGFWNPNSPTGENLEKAVQWARDQGYEAGVVVTPYASQWFGEDSVAGVNRRMPGATDDQLREYVNAADFVIVDPYIVNEQSANPDFQNWMSTFTKKVGDYAAEQGKDAWLYLQGFAPSSVGKETVEEYNQRLINENKGTYDQLSFFNMSDFPDYEDNSWAEQINIDSLYGSLENQQQAATPEEQLRVANMEQELNTRVDNARTEMDRLKTAPIDIAPPVPEPQPVPAPTFEINQAVGAGTIDDKVNEYRRLSGAGASDDQIRSLANTAFGEQSDDDWNALRSMATQQAAQGGAIKKMPWKAAGGGWAKASKAIQKAAKEAGMKAPQTAEKDLTTLQDFHTSLGDRILERSIEAQKMMEGFDYKYDKGQRVFTKDSAAKNRPPLTIVGRTRVGNQVMYERPGDMTSKKIIDPATGRAKRTPYEPGYKVRQQDGDDWMEYDIPASAILGDVEMAKGGFAKAAKAIEKASAEAEAMMPAVNRIDMNYKDVTKRVPELTEAAQKVAKGEMSPAEYDALVNKYKPVMPYGFVPAPATAEDAMRALTENKKAMFGKTNEMTAGEQADLRLDIPAYKDHGVWVNSIHRKDAPTVYGSVSSVKNATMIGAPEKAMRVATGESAKAPFAVIRGEWNPMDEATAVKNAQKYLKHKDWRQVGYDPERHGYFYDRATMMPIEGAEEVIQIGPLVLAKKPRYAKKEEQKFDTGGGAFTNTDPEAAYEAEKGTPSKAKLMAEILARMAKEQAKEEAESLGKKGATMDLINRGIVAPLAGIPVDLINMGLEGVDAIRDLASGKRVENRLASEKPVGGSEYLKDKMREYGMTTDTERPMMETGLSILSPSATGAAKGAEKVGKAAQKGARAVESGLNTATAAARRPFTPATVTVEAVAPDLAKFKPRQWQDTATKRMITGEGAPVSMSTMGGKKTTKRPGQGVYLNEAGQLETNPLVAVDVPFAGDLSKNKALRADIATAGDELAQEAMAAHRFVPMMTNEIKDASAMLIKPKKGSLTDEEVKQLGESLPGMIVAHNPRLGGVVVAPFEMPKGQIPNEFLEAQSVANAILGKRAKITYGKSEPGKDLMYMGRSDYATEGARKPSDASQKMRKRLQRAEKRLFPESGRSQSGLGAMRDVQPATVD